MKLIKLRIVLHFKHAYIDPLLGVKSFLIKSHSIVVENNKYKISVINIFDTEFLPRPYYRNIVSMTSWPLPYQDTIILYLETLYICKV